jgi:fatty-acyl-CoA synthase
MSHPSDQGIGSWPGRRARMNPDATALVQGTRRVSYRELEQRSAALAGALAGSGVVAGDRVGYLGLNDIATFEALFATARLGAIFVPINTRLAPPEVAYLLGDCGPAALVVGPELEPVFAQAHDGLVPTVIYLSSSDESSYELAVTAHEGAAPAVARVGHGDPALILYTSGTTGRPKGAVLTHGNLTWNTVNQLAHFPVSSSDVSLCAAPLFHVLGLGQITLPVLLAGGTVVVMPRFDPGMFLAAIAAERATMFPLAPTMMQMLCEHPAWVGTDLSSVRCVPYGGSPVIERVARAWLDRGIQVLQGYGMTEASPGVLMAMRHGSLERPVSAGVPHFFTDTALLTEDGTIIEGPGRGELLVRGPNVFSRYWNRPAETDAAFVDGWFRSGDIVRVDPDGWAYVVDRVKDIIISGGENIYPAEVEAAICELDGIAAAAVVGIPDDRWGEAGLAFIQLREGAAVAEAAIRGHLEGRLARYKIPLRFHFVDSLPRNAAGKLLRRPLRDQAQHLISTTGTTGTPPGEQAR